MNKNYKCNTKGKTTNIRQQKKEKKNVLNIKYRDKNILYGNNNLFKSICKSEFPDYENIRGEKKITEYLANNYKKAQGEIYNNNKKDNGNKIKSGKDKKNKSKGLFVKVRSDYILKEIFDYLSTRHKLNIIKYNKKLQKRLEISIETYKKYTNGYTICAYFENEKEIDLKLLNKDTQAYTIESENIETEINNYGAKTKSDYIVMCHVDNLDVESFNNTFKNAKLIKIITQDNSKELIKEEELNNLKKNYEKGKNKIKDYKNNVTEVKEEKVYLKISLKGLFKDFEKLEEVDLHNFDTKNVVDMSDMFVGCTNLKKIKFGENFNTENVKDMNSMFCYCKKLEELNLSNFNTENVKDMNGMFFNCKNLKELNLSNFNTKNVTDMNSMFLDCQNLKELNLSNFNTEKENDMSFMFGNCINLGKLNLSNFNTENVTGMKSMFLNCLKLEELNLSNFNTENVFNMSDMFNGCSQLINLNLQNFNTEKVNDMSHMFDKCQKLSTLDLKSFNSYSLRYMSYMFYKCSSLKNIEFNKDTFTTSLVEDMSCLFKGCSQLNNLDLSKFDISKNPDMYNFFKGCNSLTNVTLGNIQSHIQKFIEQFINAGLDINKIKIIYN